MGTSPEIIELCGIPGCGKSTLFRNMSKSNDYKIGGLGDLLNVYRRMNIITKILSFPYISVIKLLLLFIFFPKIELKSFHLYIDFVKIVILYNIRNKIEEFEYILVDHGVMQSFAGLFYNNEERFSDKSIAKISNFTKPFSPILMCYCEITIDESVQRIRKRNRNYGRMDVLDNNIILKQKLSSQSYLFQHLYEGMKNDFYFQKLSMDCSENHAVECFCELINKHRSINEN